MLLILRFPVFLGNVAAGGFGRVGPGVVDVRAGGRGAVAGVRGEWCVATGEIACVPAQPGP